MSASNPLQQTVCVWGMGGSPGSVGTYLLKNSAFAGLCGHAPHRNNFTLVKFKQVLLVIRPKKGISDIHLPPNSGFFYFF